MSERAVFSLRLYGDLGFENMDKAERLCSSVGTLPQPSKWEIAKIKS